MEEHVVELSFNGFINTINRPEARDLVRSINLFMKNFRAKTLDADSDSRTEQEFLASMEAAFAQHPLYAGATRRDLDEAMEGLEKYLLVKLFDRTFGVELMDRERDEVISARMRALQFVRPEHLEVAHDFANDSSLLMAQKELSQINACKCPRDKLACVLRCCKVINNLLSAKRYGAGADDFTPVLIYVTIRASPESLASNLAFIERYRNAARLVSEAQYFFVQMQGAAAFIETLDVHGSLKVDPDELIAHMLAAGALSDAELAMMQNVRRCSDEQTGSAADCQGRGQGPPGLDRVYSDRPHHPASGDGPAVRNLQPASSPPPPAMLDLLWGDQGMPQGGAQGPGGGTALQHGAGMFPGELSLGRNGFGGSGHMNASGGGGELQGSSTMVNVVVDPFGSLPGLQQGAPQQGPRVQQQQAWHAMSAPQPPPPPPPAPGDPFAWAQPLTHMGRPGLTPPPPPLPPIQADVTGGMSWGGVLPQHQAPPQPSPHCPGDFAQPPNSGSSFNNLAQWGAGPAYLGMGVPGQGHGAHSRTPSASTGTAALASPCPLSVPPPPPPPYSVGPLGSRSSVPGVGGWGTSPRVPPPPPPPRMPPPPPVPCTSAELEVEGNHLLAQAHSAGSLQAKYPLLYAHVDMLTLGQVRQLANDYKELVLKYEALVQATDQRVQQYQNELGAHRTLLLTSQPPSASVTAQQLPLPPTSDQYMYTPAPVSPNLHLVPQPTPPQLLSSPHAATVVPQQPHFTEFSLSTVGSNATVTQPHAQAASVAASSRVHVLAGPTAHLPPPPHSPFTDSPSAAPHSTLALPGQQVQDEFMQSSIPLTRASQPLDPESQQEPVQGNSGLATPNLAAVGAQPASAVDEQPEPASSASSEPPAAETVSEPAAHASYEPGSDGTQPPTAGRQALDSEALLEPADLAAAVFCQQVLDSEAPPEPADVTAAASVQHALDSEASPEPADSAKAVSGQQALESDAMPELGEAPAPGPSQQALDSPEQPEASFATLEAPDQPTSDSDLPPETKTDVTMPTVVTVMPAAAVSTAHPMHPSLADLLSGLEKAAQAEQLAHHPQTAAPHAEQPTLGAHSAATSDDLGTGDARLPAVEVGRSAQGPAYAASAVFTLDDQVQGADQTASLHQALQEASTASSQDSRQSVKLDPSTLQQLQSLHDATLSTLAPSLSCVSAEGQGGNSGAGTLQQAGSESLPSTPTSLSSPSAALALASHVSVDALLEDLLKEGEEGEEDGEEEGGADLFSGLDMQ